MLTLYTFGPMLGLPDPSPFCLKGEVLLKLSGLAYRLDHGGFRKAPKGKQPYLNDDGVMIADTTFIRWHLEDKRGIDFDKGLTAEQKAVAWAFEKLCEDHLYWGLVRDRWTRDDNFDKGPRRFFDQAPAVLRPLIIAKMRQALTRTLWGQGIGRHSQTDVDRLTAHAITAIADFLGDKPFLMGPSPCGADATVFGFIAALMCPLYDGPNQKAVQKHANLIAYRDRGMARWYPDFKPQG